MKKGIHMDIGIMDIEYDRDNRNWKTTLPKSFI